MVTAMSETGCVTIGVPPEVVFRSAFGAWLLADKRAFAVMIHEKKNGDLFRDLREEQH